MSLSAKSQARTTKMPEDKLKEFQKRLKAGLEELEAQYKELTASMQRNKETKEELARQGKILQKRIRRMEGMLQTFDPYAKRQASFLRKLKNFQSANEELMRLITQRLEEIEQNPEAATSEPQRLKADLLSMLSELSDMRRRREALLKSVQKQAT